jgi:hypothetical protein
MFGDKVHVNSATYDAGTSTLSVTAQSGVATSALSIDGFPAGNVTTTPGQNGSPTSFRVINVPVPPDAVVVKSNQGGVASSDVVVSGTPFSADSLKAVINGPNAAQVNAAISLDASQSSGAVTGYTWSVSGPSGSTLTPSPAQPGQPAGLGATFKAGAAGNYTITLTVAGAGGLSDTTTQTVTVSGATATPVANAGPNQTALPTSTVTLDGTASQFASGYQWTAPAGITLTGATTANPTFVAPVPASTTTYTFTLKVTDVDGSLSAPATTTVTVTPDSLQAGSLSTVYKVGSLEWRIRANLNDPAYCSANNTYTFLWNKPGASALTIGTITPTLALGVCSFDFRLRNTPTTLRPTATAPGTVTIKSALGTNLANQAISIQ